MHHRCGIGRKISLYDGFIAFATNGGNDAINSANAILILLILIRYVVFLFENQRKELIKTSAPCQPFVMCPF